MGSTSEELASAPGGRAVELDELEPLVVLPVLAVDDDDVVDSNDAFARGADPRR